MAEDFHHIIPQVYLNQFGFKKFGTKWFVSVKNLNNGKWEDREIRRFLGERGIYNLEVTSTIPNDIIEKQLNGGIERNLGTTISFLRKTNELNKDVHFNIAQITANFLCRNFEVRDWIKGMIHHEDLKDFFYSVSKSYGYSLPKIRRAYSSFVQISFTNKVSQLMIHYMNHVYESLKRMSIDLYFADENYLLFTSDNPVCFKGFEGFGYLGQDSTEIFFPISRDYLVKFYWHPIGSQLQGNLKDIPVDVYEEFHKEILPKNAKNYIISPISKDKLGR